VDGESTETTGQTGPESSAEPSPEQSPEPSLEESPEPSGDRVSAQQLVDYVERASFATTLGRRGYQQGEMDAFLVKVVETIRAGEPIAELVRRAQFATVRLEDGYDTTQVDNFLAAVVDLDPHPSAGKPELQRSGLITKLFG
jgi:DivIVA domain-containing protein